MTVYLYANDAKTILASPITTTSQTTVTVTSGTGALFPSISDPINAFFITVVSLTNPNSFEIMKVTARSGDVMTVVRGQQGISAKTFVSGSKVSQDITAGDMDNFIQKSELVQIQDPPIGSVIALAHSHVPYGYLECNGAYLKDTAYPDLFSAIWLTFGFFISGSSVYFKLPDLRGYFARPSNPATSPAGVGDNTSTGDVQLCTIQKHEHGVPVYYPDPTTTKYERRYNNGTIDDTQYTDSTGISETRPVNMAMKYYIRYTYSFPT